ncbi:unnamed protein product [Hymenolepis diminuta]|uniref:Uncharacterized protein n=1 Tax=Hymenolepis diminuta TaxID=6216 RepID=A0A0R3SQK0_HYMDI|nr:unnamed protein product [Hymenolepis diminuta]
MVCLKEDGRGGKEDEECLVGEREGVGEEVEEVNVIEDGPVGGRQGGTDGAKFWSLIVDEQDNQEHTKGRLRSFSSPGFQNNVLDERHLRINIYLAG